MFPGLSELAHNAVDFIFGKPKPEPNKTRWEELSLYSSLEEMALRQLLSGSRSQSSPKLQQAEDIEPERQAGLDRLSRIADKEYKHIRQTEKGIQQELGEVSNQQNGLSQQLNKCSQLEAATSNIEDRFKTLLQTLDANRQD